MLIVRRESISIPYFPREFVVRGWQDDGLNQADRNRVQRFLQTGRVDALPKRYREVAVRYAIEEES